MKFTDYLNEGLQDTTGVSQLDDTMIDFVINTLHIISQTHIYHWLTKSHSEHLAIGDFYEDLTEAIDAITEKVVGLKLEGNGYNNYTLVFVYNKEEAGNTIKEYRAKVSSLIEATNGSTTMSLNDELINIQKIVDVFLFKIQLQ